MFSFFRAAFYAAFLIGHVHASSLVILNHFTCELVKDYIQVSIEREQNSGLLTITTQTHSTLKIDINGGVARYSLDKVQFPLELYDQKTSQRWVIDVQCQITLLDS